MANATVDIIAPKALMIPRNSTQAVYTDGSMFISGGYLHYVSGTTLIRLSGALLAT